MRLLLIFTFIAISFAVQCPQDWTDDGSGSCYSVTMFSFPVAATYARRMCAYYNAFMFDIRNAFENTKVQTQWQNGAQFGKNEALWLGLTCLSNDTSSCLWDSGRQLKKGDYTNFQKGAPVIEDGPCVLMDTSTGLWKSASCTDNDGYFGCQYTPGIHVDDCNDNFDIGLEAEYFRGNCYFISGKFNWSANIWESTNKATGAESVSIHSQGENEFFADLADARVNTLIGLRKNGENFSWTDGSPFDYDNVQDGSSSPSNSNVSCATMTPSVPRNEHSGKWSLVDCVSPLANVNGATKWKYVAPTYPNLNCSQTVYLKGRGMLSSPGYPNSSGRATCEYVITQEEDYWAQINFSKILLDDEDVIRCYNGTDATTPFQTLKFLVGGGGCHVPGNVLRIVFQTSGNYATYFAGEYAPRQPDQQ